jgi:hypothetical protein
LADPNFAHRFGNDFQRHATATVTGKVLIAFVGGTCESTLHEMRPPAGAPRALSLGTAPLGKRFRSGLRFSRSL